MSTSAQPQIRRIGARDGWRCNYCDVPLRCEQCPDHEYVSCVLYMGTVTHPLGHCVAQRDHVIPKSRGGSNLDENIVLACWHCNTKKGIRNADEFRALRAAVA
jgi:5-methylcytosine-specific restriction endonuclease McrA